MARTGRSHSAHADEAQNPENRKDRNHDADISVRKDGAAFAPGRQCFGMHAKAYRFARAEEALAKLHPLPAIHEPRPGGRELRRDAARREQPSRQRLFAGAWCGHWKDIRTATRGRRGRGRAHRDATDRESARLSRPCLPIDHSIAPDHAHKTQSPGCDSGSKTSNFSCSTARTMNAATGASQQRERQNVSAAAIVQRRESR